MSAIARDLCSDLTAQFSARVVAAVKVDKKWSLRFEDDTALSDFDAVALAVPAPQAVPLLAESPALARRAEEIRMLPCHALMVRFESDLEVGFDAAFVRDSPLSWIAHNATKPDREFGPTWLLHSTPEWSGANLESTPEQTRAAFLAALQSATGSPAPAIEFFAAHRWLYARPDGHCGGNTLWDTEGGIGACGDWVEGDRVESAYLSAESLAKEILGR